MSSTIQSAPTLTSAAVPLRPVTLATVAGLPLARVAVRRLLIALPVLFGVTLLTFFVLNVLPGNAAVQLLGPSASAEQVAQLEATLELDRPAWQRYGRWLGGVLKGNLGRSLASAEPVTRLVSERFPVTLELVVYAFALSLGFAIPLALYCARRPNGVADRITMLVSMAGLSLANYVLALVLVLGLAVRVAWFPAIGFVSANEGLLLNLRSLTLPAIALAFPLLCFYTRFLRGDLVEQLNTQEYALAAIAKGIGPWRVLIVHVLRNSLPGLLTVVGLNFGGLLGGTVIIEQIFALPGMGQLLLHAINTRDVAVVQSIVLLLAVASVLANIGVDILHAALDPRIRHDSRAD